MNPVFSVSQMREVDSGSIGSDTTVGYFYMQKAGMGLLRAIHDIVDDPASGEIAVLCGKGNNGGDGFVVARLLLHEGYDVTCFSMAAPEHLSGESLIAYREFISSKGVLHLIDDIVDIPRLSHFSLVVDALLGTGLKGDPHGLFAAIIELINSSGVKVLSVDTPSGLNNDTGIPQNPCIKADITVTMGYSKPGQYFFPGKQQVGKLFIEDLAYPEEIICNIKPTIFIPSLYDFRKMLPPRKPAGSKIDHGRILIIGGSPGMTGSITMSAEAALRTGCGMVHCAFPESLATILSIKLTEPVLHPLPQTAEGTAAQESAATVMTLAEKAQALCIGPGISCSVETAAMVRDVVRNCSKPLVLDADGINAFAEVVDTIGQHGGELLLTPHRGEWERLFGTLPAMPLDRITRMREIANRYHITVLLKGNPTIVADSHGQAFILPYGNSALAKAGSGDVLSGIIVALIGQGASVTDAALLGAYIHGTAGCSASSRSNEYSVTARDVIDCIATGISSII